MPSGWLDLAQYLTITASNLSALGFGAAKASTKLGFSIARGIVSIAPIPFLTTSLNHLENFSLLPILLGETITSTSLNAASVAIAHLLQANQSEASFSLTSFVELVRREWDEFGVKGRSVIEVSRALAAWAAIQGFTKEWSEERWFRGVTELTPVDFKPKPKRKKENGAAPQQPPTGLRRTVSKVSITEDFAMRGRQSQIISADIGEKVFSGDDFGSPARLGEHRSNYEDWKTLRRLSKIVLAGYGGAGLLFFGTPLKPDVQLGKTAEMRIQEESKVQPNDTEEGILLHAVEDAEAEADTMSPTRRDLSPMRGSEEPNFGKALRRQISFIKPDAGNSSTSTAYSYSWWNVLLGKHDRDIFEGYAFQDADAESDRDTIRTPSVSSSPTTSYFPSRMNSLHGDLIGSSSEKPKAQSSEPKRPKTPRLSTAVIGDLNHMPRFWVLTDHVRKQVVVVVRGTMSFNELAADLTCEPAFFTPATMSTPASTQLMGDVCEPPTAQEESSVFTTHPAWGEDDDVNTSVHINGLMSEARKNHKHLESPPSPRWSEDGGTRLSSRRSTIVGSPAVLVEEEAEPEPEPAYEVHGGMLKLARAMGSKGKPVHEAVASALAKNRQYELVLSGHSLGAGLATLFALMWADPVTCRTVPSSGLPPNHRVSVYCIAPPCVTSGALSRLCKNMVTSIVYSYDFVSRLSLGSIRDLNKAAYWLCEGEGDASTVNILRWALQGKLGFGGIRPDTEDDKKWFIAVRKTLEANMHYTHLYPPGKVWWAVRNESIHPSHQLEDGREGIRLFEVLQVEDVFRQIEFKGDMLSAHLPNQYDRIISELEF